MPFVIDQSDTRVLSRSACRSAVVMGWTFIDGELNRFLVGLQSSYASGTVLGGDFLLSDGAEGVVVGAAVLLVGTEGDCFVDGDGELGLMALAGVARDEGGESVCFGRVFGSAERGLVREVETDGHVEDSHPYCRTLIPH